MSCPRYDGTSFLIRSGFVPQNEDWVLVLLTPDVYSDSPLIDNCPNKKGRHSSKHMQMALLFAYLKRRTYFFILGVF